MKLYVRIINKMSSWYVLTFISGGVYCCMSLCGFVAILFTAFTSLALYQPPCANGFFYVIQYFVINPFTNLLLFIFLIVTVCILFYDFVNNRKLIFTKKCGI